MMIVDFSVDGMYCHRHNGSEGFPRRSTDNEEVAASEADPALCRVHAG